jgi:tetratricopeptide (TPR) repeat protein
MEYKLKSISQAGIPEANSKAELYRLLSEPAESESICQDVLLTDPENQVALRQLAMAISDQFTGSPADRYLEAEVIIQKLSDDYERLYYTGLLHERRAKAQLRAGRPPHTLLVLFEEALRCYEQAERIRPRGNDDSLLRWNRCVRILQGRAETDWSEKAEIAGIGDSGSF